MLQSNPFLNIKMCLLKVFTKHLLNWILGIVLVFHFYSFFLKCIVDQLKQDQVLALTAWHFIRPYNGIIFTNHHGVWYKRYLVQIPN